MANHDTTREVAVWPGLGRLRCRRVKSSVDRPEATAGKVVAGLDP